MNNSFSPQKIAHKLGYKIPLKAINWLTGDVYSIDRNLFAAYVTIDGDNNCPYGVFPLACAVDNTKEDASIRAVCESIERYCLGAIRCHTDQFYQESDIPSNEIFTYSYGMKKPFISKRKDAKFIKIQPVDPTLNDNLIQYANLGDIFAPYPIKTGHCGYFPTTNGVALGYDKKNAIISAIKEYLERDSIMRFWYLGDYTSSVPLSKNSISLTCPESYDFLDKLGYEIFGFDISIFTNLFITLVFAKHKNKKFPYIVCSAATDFCLKSALKSSLLELIQTTIAIGSRTEDYVKWSLRGGKVKNLDDRMFFYASKDKVKDVANLLEGLYNRKFNKTDKSDSTCTIDEKHQMLLNEINNKNITMYYCDITRDNSMRK